MRIHIRNRKQQEVVLKSLKLFFDSTSNEAEKKACIELYDVARKRFKGDLPAFLI